ncbi:MAG: prepilin peptidase [Sediminimonas sp.]|uniref:prepilin peptidase n=1 Tax=Sediminimonas sp. TaxID=2823379 RepID=UPI00287002E7|nr:prepilin peptidase [Sediminimonas sp.]MDR9484124.1 prepilin peptidase [Sediminimonas sp.]
MTLEIPAFAAAWFLPVALPLGLWVAWSDLRDMRISNRAVLALVVLFLLIGPLVLPLPVYGWQLLHLVVVLLVGMVLNAAGLLGAGDAKFAAAAAPFIALGDIRFVIALFAANLLAAFATHRLAVRTPLRRLAPDWQSWTRTKEFPMGLSLGPTLAIYLTLGAVYGSGG